MAVLIIADNSGIGCAGWVLRSIISSISETLDETQNQELANWLTSESSPVQLYSVLDLRDLKIQNQEAFINAIIPSYIKTKSRGPKEGSDPCAWEGYIKIFDNLVRQIEALAQGKTPENLANLNGIPKHDGSREGPGW